MVLTLLITFNVQAELVKGVLKVTLVYLKLTVVNIFLTTQVMVALL
jgi:hypothetical protein